MLLTRLHSQCSFVSVVVSSASIDIPLFPSPITFFGLSCSGILSLSIPYHSRGCIQTLLLCSMIASTRCTSFYISPSPAARVYCRAAHRTNRYLPFTGILTQLPIPWPSGEDIQYESGSAPRRFKPSSIRGTPNSMSLGPPGDTWRPKSSCSKPSAKHVTASSQRLEIGS